MSCDITWAVFYILRPWRGDVILPAGCRCAISVLFLAYVLTSWRGTLSCLIPPTPEKIHPGALSGESRLQKENACESTPVSVFMNLLMPNISLANLPRGSSMDCGADVPLSSEIRKRVDYGELRTDGK